MKYLIRDGTHDNLPVDAATMRVTLNGLQDYIRRRVYVVPVTLGEPVPAEEWLRGARSELPTIAPQEGDTERPGPPDDDDGSVAPC